MRDADRSIDNSRFDPYNADRPLLMRCACGQHASADEHNSALSAASAVSELKRRSETTEFEAYSNDFIEATLVKALFPQDAMRRRFLRAVGKGGAMAAIGSVLPVASLQAMAQEKGTLEKTELKIGFIPITCATLLIMAHPLGFYSKQIATAQRAAAACGGTEFFPQPLQRNTT